MGSSVKHNFSGQVAGTKVEVVNGGTGNNVVTVTLRYLIMLNTTAAVAYLQVFANDSDDVTVGTTVPDLSIGLPASAGLVFPVPESGIWMGGKGLTLAGTTTRTGATGAAIDVNLGFEG
jgi:hypothetical protein